MLVRDVVGELELVEGDDLLHPLLAGGRAVRVDVHALWHLRVRLASHYPTAKKRKNQQRIMKMVHKLWVLTDSKNSIGCSFILGGLPFCPPHSLNPP